AAMNTPLRIHALRASCRPGRPRDTTRSTASSVATAAAKTVHSSAPAVHPSQAAGRTVGTRVTLHVEAKVHHVAVAHDVLLALEAHAPRFLGTLLALALD